MMPVRHVIIALLVVVIFGLAFPVIKLGLAESTPLLLTGLRFTFSALPAIFFISKPKVSWAALVAYGVLIGVLQFGLLFTAIHLGVASGLASLIVQLHVFFTIALSFLLFGEKPTSTQLCGSLLAFGGMVLIAEGRFSSGSFFGVGLVILAALSWAGGNLIIKRIGKVDMLAFTIWSSLAAPLPLFAMSYAFEGAGSFAVVLHPTWSLAMCVFYMAVAGTLTGYGLWNWLLARHSAASVGPFALLIPIVGIACGNIFFGERLQSQEIYGAGLIFFGLCLNVFGSRILVLLRRA